MQVEDAAINAKPSSTDMRTCGAGEAQILVAAGSASIRAGNARGESGAVVLGGGAGLRVGGGEEGEEEDGKYHAFIII